MRKRFKDIKVGDKIFVEKLSYFVQSTELKNGYLKITIYPKREGTGYFLWNGYDYYIPMNHLNASKVKIKGLWFFLSPKAYKKYMYEFIKQQISK